MERSRGKDVTLVCLDRDIRGMDVVGSVILLCWLHRRMRDVTDNGGDLAARE